MFTYDQKTGQLTDAGGQIIGNGYSGHGQGVNNPAMENIPGVGPIPRGAYIIGAAQDHPKLGPTAMPLIPQEGTDTHGRGGFFMHGDNSQGNESASEGCIIMPLRTRISIVPALHRGLYVC